MSSCTSKSTSRLSKTSGSPSHSDRYLQKGRVQKVLNVAGLGYKWGKKTKMMSVGACESGEVAKINIIFKNHSAGNLLVKEHSSA